MAALITLQEFKDSVAIGATDTDPRLQRWLDASQGQIEDRVGPIASHPLEGTAIFDASISEAHLSAAIRLRDQYQGAQVTEYGTDEPVVPGGFPPLSPRDAALLAPYATYKAAPLYSFPDPPSWAC